MRIFDTFPFDGETELLQHHLHEAFDHVDAFVLVEAGVTYRGQPKEFTFEKNREQFAWAENKLRYIKLASLGPADLEPRARAAIQRNAVMMAVRDAASGKLKILNAPTDGHERAVADVLGITVER